MAKAETEPDYLHTKIVVADPDQDGVPEVVVGKNKVVTVPYLTSNNVYDIAPVDLDGDGKLEIVAINGRNRLQVFKGGELRLNLQAA